MFSGIANSKKVHLATLKAAFLNAEYAAADDLPKERRMKEKAIREYCERIAEHEVECFPVTIQWGIQ